MVCKCFDYIKDNANIKNEEVELNMLKKIALCGFLLLINWSAQASVERYVAAIEKVKLEYQGESREFFRGLDPQLTEFSPTQKTQYCAILQKYADGLYKAADKNRQSLDRNFRNMTKQDVITEVQNKTSILNQKYQLNCDLK